MALHGCKVAYGTTRWQDSVWHCGTYKAWMPCRRVWPLRSVCGVCVYWQWRRRRWWWWWRLLVWWSLLLRKWCGRCVGGDGVFIYSMAGVRASKLARATAAFLLYTLCLCSVPAICVLQLGMGRCGFYSLFSVPVFCAWCMRAAARQGPQRLVPSSGRAVPHAGPQHTGKPTITNFDRGF